MDSLIHNHIHSISNLLARGSEIEEQISELNSDYVSQLSEYSDRLRQLKSSYRHLLRLLYFPLIITITMGVRPSK
jgi:hypothetical protein